MEFAMLKAHRAASIRARRVILALTVAATVGILSSPAHADSPANDLPVRVPRLPVGTLCSGVMSCAENGDMGVSLRGGVTLGIRDDKSISAARLEFGPLFSFFHYAEVFVYFPFTWYSSVTPVLEPLRMGGKFSLWPPHKFKSFRASGILDLSLPIGRMNGEGSPEGPPPSAALDIGAVVEGRIGFFTAKGSLLATVSKGRPDIHAGAELGMVWDYLTVFVQVVADARLGCSAAESPACVPSVLAVGGFRVVSDLAPSALFFGGSHGGGWPAWVLGIQSGLTYNPKVAAKYGDGIASAEARWRRMGQAIQRALAKERLRRQFEELIEDLQARQQALGRALCQGPACPNGVPLLPPHPDQTGPAGPDSDLPPAGSTNENATGAPPDGSGSFLPSPSAVPPADLPTATPTGQQAPGAQRQTARPRHPSAPPAAATPPAPLAVPDGLIPEDALADAQHTPLFIPPLPRLALPDHRAAFEEKLMRDHARLEQLKRWAVAVELRATQAAREVFERIADSAAVYYTVEAVKGAVAGAGDAVIPMGPYLPFRAYTHTSAVFKVSRGVTAAALGTTEILLGAGAAGSGGGLTVTGAGTAGGVLLTAGGLYVVKHGVVAAVRGAQTIGQGINQALDGYHDTSAHVSGTDGNAEHPAAGAAKGEKTTVTAERTAAEHVDREAAERLTPEARSQERTRVEQTARVGGDAEGRSRGQFMQADPQAGGAHTTFVRDPHTQKVYKYQEWDKNGMPMKRADAGSNSSNPNPHSHYPAGIDHMHTYQKPYEAPDGRIFPGKKLKTARNLEPDEMPK